MGKKKKGMKMPARVNKVVAHAKQPEKPVITPDTDCTHWSTKKNRCRLGTVCGSGHCQARHPKTPKN